MIAIIWGDKCCVREKNFIRCNVKVSSLHFSIFFFLLFAQRHRVEFAVFSRVASSSPSSSWSSSRSSSLSKSFYLTISLSLSLSRLSFHFHFIVVDRITTVRAVHSFPSPSSSSSSSLLSKTFELCASKGDFLDLLVVRTSFELFNKIKSKNWIDAELSSLSSNEYLVWNKSMPLFFVSLLVRAYQFQSNQLNFCRVKNTLPDRNQDSRQRKSEMKIGREICALWRHTDDTDDDAIWNWFES